MRSISIDFNNNIICIMTEGQQGTEHAVDQPKVKFNSFIPEQFRENNSFTWNFEDELFVVNKDITLKAGCIMTEEDFVPHLIVPMPGLGKRYDEFIAIMGYEESSLLDEMDDVLKYLLGLE